MTKKNRATTALTRLKKVFPNAHCELIHKNIFELFVAVQLSAQCTDARVNIITPPLFERITNWKELRDIPQLELEKYIFSSGFYRNKAKNLRAAGKMIHEEYNDELPQNIQEMTKIPGVARKTANVVLETGFGIVEGVVVDTHVRRIANLLGLTKEQVAEKIEKDLMKILPKEYWGEVGHMFVWHGRRTCIARKPQCNECSLVDICPSNGVGIKVKKGK